MSVAFLVVALVMTAILAVAIFVTAVVVAHQENRPLWTVLRRLWSEDARRVHEEEMR